MSDDEYYTIRTRGLSDLPVPSRPSPLRAAVLFSSAVLALSVLVVPALDGRRVERVAAMLPGRAPALDMTTVGSVRPYDLDALRGARAFGDEGLGNARAATPAPLAAPRGAARTYTVRRSVLNRGSVCVIHSDGARTGAC